MTVRIKIRLLGIFRALSSENQISLNLKRPTVQSALLKLTRPLSVEAKRLLIDQELADPRPNALILVNGKEINVMKGLETQLKDGDEVTLIPVSHGG